MKRAATLALAVFTCAAPSLGLERNVRAEAELLACAGEAKVRLAVIRRRSGVSSGADLAEAVRLLSEARRLDGGNLRALGSLGIARFEASRTGKGSFDRVGFDGAREPLERLFRVTRGWADPGTREIIRGVTEYLDSELSLDDESGGEAAAWWRRWRAEAIVPGEGGLGGSELAEYVARLRGAPEAWVREDAARVLGASGVRRADITEALARALRGDRAPWVRAAAADALVALSPPGWETLLVPPLQDDPSAHVRRSVARAFGTPPRRLLRDDTYRALRVAMSDTPVVASAAALTLGEHGAHGVLLPALRSSSSLVRLGAAWGVLDGGGEAIRRELRGLLEDPDPRVRLAAARGLPGDAGATRVLESLLSSRAPLGALIASETRTVGEAAEAILTASGRD